MKIENAIAKAAKDVAMVTESVSVLGARKTEMENALSGVYASIKEAEKPFDARIALVVAEKKEAISALVAKVEDLRVEIREVENRIWATSHAKNELNGLTFIKQVMDMQDKGYFITEIWNIIHKTAWLGQRAHNNYRPHGWITMSIIAKPTGFYVQTNISESPRKVAEYRDVKKVVMQNGIKIDCRESRNAYKSGILCPECQKEQPSKYIHINDWECPVCREFVVGVCPANQNHVVRKECKCTVKRTFLDAPEIATIERAEESA